MLKVIPLEPNEDGAEEYQVLGSLEDVIDTLLEFINQCKEDNVLEWLVEDETHPVVVMSAVSIFEEEMEKRVENSEDMLDYFIVWSTVNTNLIKAIEELKDSEDISEDDKLHVLGVFQGSARDIGTIQMN